METREILLQFSSNIPVVENEIQKNDWSGSRKTIWCMGDNRLLSHKRDSDHLILLRLIIDFSISDIIVGHLMVGCLISYLLSHNQTLIITLLKIIILL